MGDVRPKLVIATADMHVNSTLGLCPPQGVQLDDGGYYKPGTHQLWSWEKWEEFHRDMGGIAQREDAEIIYVVVGDAVDGNHHQTTQIISGNMEVQGYLAEQVFDVPLSLKPSRLYFVRGTETHTGPSGSSEEALAKHLKAVRDVDTQNWSVWHKRFDVHGKLFEFQHHMRIGTRPQTRRSILTYLAFQIWTESLAAGERVPDFVIGGDKHIHGQSGCDDLCPVNAIVVPPWQFKTGFGHKVAAFNQLYMGGVGVMVWPDGETRTHFKSYHPPLPAIERIT